MSGLPLISFRRYFDELTDEHIITFEAWTKEAQEKLLPKILAGKSVFTLEACYRKGKTLILKPDSLGFNHRYNQLTLEKANQTLALNLDDELLDLVTQLQDSNIYFELKPYKKIPVSQKKAVYLCELIAIYEADYDFDTAKELLKEYKPADLLLLAVGYKPDSLSLATRLPQFLPLFQYEDKAIHVFMLTPPRYGKTRTAAILRSLSSSYLTVFPSPAKLVYDGAKNTYGLTYFYNTLYIDEIDKVAGGRRQDTFKESYEILLTGMSEGYWLRDVSSKAEDFRNVVSFCFMGNSKSKELGNYTQLSDYSKSARYKIREMFSYVDNPEAFVERLAYCEIITESVQAYKLLNYSEDKRVMYLHPRVARAVIKLLQDGVKEQPVHRNVECELDHHFNAVKSVLNVLEVELSDSTIESLVRGELTFTDVLVSEEKQGSSIDYEELRAPDMSEMLFRDGVS
ncbi:hypothetical protein DRH29_05025 [candidate division Kazan bacterium]|uniref:Uncharacterized protein n=1 Tax=candidate division Kazan bacterium TaxID=2202143 RepID=A0A420ZBD0_UNCK3|nr:MAG: hypothetical protein DRH29_05025 [candidate division Kazan bacterium]